VRTIIRRALAVAGTLTLTAAGLATTAPIATAADPVTTSASFPRGTMSVAFSDTTLQAGDAFTVEVDLTNTFTQLNISTFVIQTPDVPSNNLFVLDGCTTATGQDPYCSTPQDEVRAQVLVPAAGSESITFDLHVSDDAPAGTYPLDFFADIAGTTATLSPPVTFTVAPPTADLAVDLSATAGPLLGSQITYDLDVSNEGSGDASASSVQVKLPHLAHSVSNLPGACTYASSTDVVTCDTGAVAFGDTSSVSFKANIALLSIGSLNATATRVSSSPADPNPANDTSTAHCGSITGLIIVC
jgi:hypothetical protein